MPSPLEPDWWNSFFGGGRSLCAWDPNGFREGLEVRGESARLNPAYGIVRLRDVRAAGDAGSIDALDLEAEMLAGMSLLRHCYGVALRERPSARGSFVARFRHEPGACAALSVLSLQGDLPTSLGACVEAGSFGFAAPADARPSDATLTFSLETR